MSHHPSQLSTRLLHHSTAPSSSKPALFRTLVESGSRDIIDHCLRELLPLMSSRSFQVDDLNLLVLVALVVSDLLPRSEVEFLRYVREGEMRSTNSEPAAMSRVTRPVSIQSQRTLQYLRMLVYICARSLSLPC
jgi:hypothetical protein